MAFLLAPAIVFLDQLSKYLVVNSGIFWICNKGVAFGFGLSSFPVLVISVLALFSIFVFYAKTNYKKRRIALLLIAGGGASNLVDRVMRGCVLDFIDLKWFPAFNIADFFITAGVILMFYTFLKASEK